MSYRRQYQQQGYLTALDVIDAAAAARHRRQLEKAEVELGPAHYLAKIHTVLKSPAQLASHPAILDVVEQLIGADILVYNVTYIIKEANTSSHASWHQDLTYWGLDCDDQVSLWLALSEASPESGCMRVIPGSHQQGRRDRILGEQDKDNLLFQNQRVADIDESRAVNCALAPGQASLHHGWLLHGSASNQSGDRRIGLNVQYIAPHVRQIKKPGISAWLVRGQDRYGYYADEYPASSDLEPIAIERRQQLEILHRDIAAHE